MEETYESNTTFIPINYETTVTQNIEWEHETATHTERAFTI